MSSQQSEQRLYTDGVESDRIGELFTSGLVPIAVYGLGKMGLPLAAVFADVSGNVVGVDIDEAVVATIESGECHITGEPGLPALVTETVQDGALEATTDPVAAARDAQLHVVIVPTLLTDGAEPDLSTLQAAVESIGAGLSPGDMVVVESTVPPGTCRDLVLPILQTESDVPAEEFGLAFCPERTASGRALEDIRGSYPKVVGGIDDSSTAVAAGIYDRITGNEILTVSDTQTAESVKVFEGVYRDVNIALANELATLTESLDVDVLEAIETANTQPFCDIHTPGPGVGGHCIPYYPYFLIDQVDHELDLIQTARTVNDAMPDYVVDTVINKLKEAGVDPGCASILVLGGTYRAGVKETQKSPAASIIESLSEYEAGLRLADPMLDEAALAEFAAEPVDLRAVSNIDPDAVILVTAHEEFDRLDSAIIEDPVFIDTRQFWEEPPSPAFVIGRGEV